jgi:hypothetical protein
MNLAEQIASLEAKRAANVARMEAVLKKGIDEGRTTEAGEKEEVDTLQAEIEQIDGDLVRLKTLQKIKGETAKPVNGDTRENGADSRDPAAPAIVLQSRGEELARGIRFARFVKARAVAGLMMKAGNLVSPLDIAKSMYPRDVVLHNILVAKANVTAGGTNPTHHWGSQLVGTETAMFADFVEWLRPQTIVGRFGQGGIPALRQVPFRVALVGQTSGGAGYWVGESQAKPLTKFDFSRTTLAPLKVANIAVITMELLRDSSPSAETIVRDQLGAALRERTDIDFIDPAKAAVAGVSPASITQGIVAIPSGGNQLAAIEADVAAMFAAFIAANNPPTSGVWIMSATTALRLSMVRTDLGNYAFPGISMSGGTFFNLPVIVSEHVPVDTAGGYVMLVNASDIYFADDGEVAVDMSQEASLQMLDNPTNASDSPPVATQLVSLWQTNSVGFRAERTLNWARRRASAVAVLGGVHWGEAGSP